MKTHLIPILLAAVFLTACRPQASKPEAIPADITSAAGSLPASNGPETYTSLPQLDTNQIYTQKELRHIQDSLAWRLQAVTDDTVGENVTGYGLGQNHVLVSLRRATPRLIEQFRRKVMDSPAIKFSGPDTPFPDTFTAPTEVRGVSLRALTSVLPLSDRMVTLELINRGDVPVFYGEMYSMTYEDPKGVWRNYPGEDFFIAVEHELPARSVHRLTARLYPLVNEHFPTRFRYFHRVGIGSAQDVLLMCEFRLADVSAPTLLPPTIIPQDTIANPRSPEEPLYDLVDEMPEFPGGLDSLFSFIKRQKRPDTCAMGRIIIRFVVEKDGSLTHLEVLRGIDAEADSFAIRTVRAMPRWKPGRNKGRTVPVRLIIPIIFRLQ